MRYVHVREQVSLLTSSYTLASYALDGNFQLRERRADIVDLLFYALRLSGLCMSAETVRSEVRRRPRFSCLL